MWETVYNFIFEPYEQRDLLLIVLEFIAFVFGILSVYFAKLENIWVYPTGLIATVITAYLLYTDQLFGDMSMNVYYSIMSVYGWYKWSRTQNHKAVLHISRTNTREKALGVLFFTLTLIVTYTVYKVFGKELDWTNYIDIFTSGLFFTAMWYMAIKKIENWTLWIVADLITVPLYAYRGWGMFSLQYFVFLILAIQGYLAWKKEIDLRNELRKS